MNMTPFLFFEYFLDILHCNLRFFFFSFLTLAVLLIFLYSALSEHTARVFMPISIPIPSLTGFTVFSGTSIPTEIHQFIPSKVTLGLEYFALTGILPFSASLI